jgi:CRISPR-associated protein Csx10
MNDWHIFDLQINADSPIHLGDESDIGNFMQTRNAIPGANLRAAVAARALATCTRPEHKANHSQCPDGAQCPFWQIFDEQREPLFGHAYPGKSGPAYPFPLTARTCKQYPGYPGDQESGHGVFDVLVDQFVYGLLSDPQFPMRDMLQPSLSGDGAALTGLLSDACPQCSSAMSPAQGTYVERPGGTPDYAGKLSVRRATHVGINRARSVAEDSLLYTMETIQADSAPVAFHSRVTAPSKCLAILRDYLKGHYYVGRGRSRGLGSVTFSVRQERDGIADLGKRLTDFENAIRAELSQYAAQDKRVVANWPGTLFSVTLHSPAILQAFGQPQARLTPEMLGLPQAKLLQSWARTEVVTGWAAAANLPRRTCLAVQTGSAFVYWVPPEINTEALLQELERIEIEGVGEERPRGYGQLSICAPFHRHNRMGNANIERSKP